MPLNRTYARISEIPDRVPLLPLGEVIVLPHGELPLNIFEPRYLMMVDNALSGDRLIGIIQPMTNDDMPEALESVGCVGRITSYQETGDGRYLLCLTGIARFKLISSAYGENPYLTGTVDYKPYAADLQELQPPQTTADVEGLFAVLQSYFELQYLETDWKALRSAPIETVLSAMVMVLPLNSAEKQALLETQGFAERLQLFIALTERLVTRMQSGEHFSLQ